MSRSRATLAVSIVVFAACGSTASPSASQSAPATAPATATPPPSVIPSPSAAPAGPAIELEASSEPLPAGRYTHTGFDPAITFQLDEGWFAGTLDDGFFDVQQDRNTPDVVAVQFGRVQSVVGAGEEPSAESAAAAIRANPQLTILGESESRIGGLDGVNVEVENGSGSHASIFAVSLGALGIDSGRRLWISLFDTDDGLLAIMVGGSTAQWDRALTLAEPVLESITMDAEGSTQP